MKLLNRINQRLALNGEPYTADEINNHDDANRIWATIAQCKEEAGDAYRKGFGDGLWAAKKP